MKPNNILRGVDSVNLIEVPNFIDSRGDLTVFQENSHVPFSISRVFTVTALANSVRGQHAHKRCSQFMVCLYGSIEIICNDGFVKKRFLLDRSNLGLMMPPGIWAEEIYKKDHSILLVLCDYPYDESDYILSIQELKEFKEKKINEK
jgi:dTDP-4-dehydrorhamnose 3,5-epimerase-like enzyme